LLRPVSCQPDPKEEVKETRAGKGSIVNELFAIQQEVMKDDDSEQNQKMGINDVFEDSDGAEV
jgi:hypothetical protein